MALSNHVLKVGQCVTVPSGMGGVWDCIVIETTNRHGEVAVKITNPQHPDFDGRYMVVNEKDVRR